MSERVVSVLLTNMLEATDAIQRYTAGLDYESFLSNALVRDAVIRNVQVIGEAANRIPKPFRDQHTSIEWSVSFAHATFWYTIISGWIIRLSGELSRYIYPLYNRPLPIY